ncbi:MAG: hypothetical protein A3B90_00680 [Candidatus Magasanikbacteria bacterium RIFCSPHIGHO2_02_FULL_41_13]|uniref:Type I restriction modification DNA specificity domain-containing protein n=1 Tax=Candidatus Magasanikbacteria bacterium RIFCSPHIGHO2_02_FULL_41_13 TaxID=1798676 RepID=A0A1F6M6S9_9BACT|nr:MAG: hypothetical protein A3B90_00680 [Candidatus Magasanikbacteria bacterium RIFCSPHIGHO2_02_FULL_41_13]
MQYNFKKFTSIISGYSFRGAVISDIAGGFRVAQVRDITDTQKLVDRDLLTPVAFDHLESEAFLQHNDVLLSTRGTETGGFRVGLYDGHATNIIASSALYVLRIKDDKLLSEYLTYYLSSNRGQRALQQITSGSTIKVILKKELEQLKIPVPPIEAQKHIIEAIKNIHEQKDLINRKKELLENISTFILDNIQ